MEIKTRESQPKINGYTSLADARFELGTQDLSQVPKIDGKYITGLDKYSPTVKSISDEKERDKKIKELEKIRKTLEVRLGVNLDQDTEEGKKYWSEFVINFEAVRFLNPNNPVDQLMTYIIKENSVFNNFPVAKEKDVLGGDVVGAKDYYISDNKKDLQESVSRKRKLGRAEGLIDELLDKDPSKLRMIAVHCLPSYIPITRKTDPVYIYDKMSDFLHGEIAQSKTSKSKNVETFFKFYSLDIDELTIQTTLRKALNYNIIVKNNATGEYFNRVYPEYRYGKTMEEVESYFKDPSNQEDLGIGKNSDKEYSLAYLISKREPV